jgi:hypothetical protein
VHNSHALAHNRDTGIGCLPCSIQRAFFQQQEKLGKLKLRAPTPPKPKLTLKERYGIPEHLDRMLKDPEEAMSLTFSKQLWENTVPGEFHLLCPYGIKNASIDRLSSLFQHMDWFFWLCTRRLKWSCTEMLHALRRAFLLHVMYSLHHMQQETLRRAGNIHF